MRQWCRVAAVAAVAVHDCHVRYYSSTDDDSSSGDGGSSSSGRRTTRVVLPTPPYGLPASAQYEAERQGGYSTRWLLHDVPRQKHNLAAMSTTTDAATAEQRGDVHVSATMTTQAPHLWPSKDAFWRSPPHEALTLLARAQPYDVTLQVIMQHSFFFLLEELPHAHDAPLPHRMYEDMMQCLTFASLQSPPEWQFALPQSLLRTLLCIAAYHCTVDRHYFTAAQRLYRMMEQQQHTSAAMRSAWVYVCTAAGQLDAAVAAARAMARHAMPFDEEVFALMQHPSVHAAQLRRGELSPLARGIVMQRRLCRQLATAAAAVANDAALFTYDEDVIDEDDMSATAAAHDEDNDGRAPRTYTTRTRSRSATTRAATTTTTTTTLHGTAAAVAVHAMFVYHALTLRHARKWEVLRCALEAHITLTPRTLALAVDVFAREKGVRCGARTVRALVNALVREHSGCGAAAVLFVLLRVRKNELLPALAALPRVTFTAEEAEELMAVVQRRARVRGEADYAAAAPLLRALVCNDEPAHVMRELAALTPPRSSGGSGSAEEEDAECGHSDGVTALTSTRNSDDNNDHTSVTTTTAAATRTHIAALLRRVAALDAAAQSQRQRTHAAAALATQQRDGDAAVVTTTTTTMTARHDAVLHSSALSDDSDVSSLVDRRDDAHDAAVHEHALRLERMRRGGVRVGQRLLTQHVLREQLHTQALQPYTATAWVHPGYRDDTVATRSGGGGVA